MPFDFVQSFRRRPPPPRRGRIFPSSTPHAATPVVIDTPADVTLVLDVALGVTITLN